MNPTAALANTLWLARSWRATRAFDRALSDPAGAQDAWLRTQLARHASSAFGRTHDFARIRDAATFAREVPLTDYAGVEPYVDRVRRGERDVLACGEVTHLAPTSGTSGARKLIPFTASLQEGFDAAVSPWIFDLSRQRPALRWGPAYWSISPLADEAPAPERSVGIPLGIPVGFADDADHLGGSAAWLVRRALAVPPSLRFVTDPDAFWALSLLALLRQRDLRLISIWHPSFLDLLVSRAESLWPALLDAIASGGAHPWTNALPAHTRSQWNAAPSPSRAAELRRRGATDWPRWWPRLQVLSCWGDQAAAAGWKRLVARVPEVLVQPKGLLATEAVITIPYGTETPLAITSHFFEFLDDSGNVRRAHELERGAHYEVIVTNGGGLWRYRIGDQVECTGHLRAAPTLRFLGRAGNVSDLRGEKLSEPFVADALRGLWDDQSAPEYATLHARDGVEGAGYDLWVSTETLAESLEQVAHRLEGALLENPHYALARRLGQLQPLRALPVAPGFAAQELRARGQRLGDAKPRTLVGWQAHDRP